MRLDARSVDFFEDALDLQFPDVRLSQGKPREIWETVFVKFLGEDWKEVALSRTEWRWWEEQVSHELWRQEVFVYS